MRQCPKCGKNYSDNTLNFCLDDGTPLSFRSDSEPTLVGPIVPASFIPPPAIPSQPRQPSPSPYRWFLLAAVIVVAIMLGGGAVAFLYRMNSWSSPAREKPLAKEKPSMAPSPTEETDSRSALSVKSPSPTPSVEPSRTTTVPNLTGEWRLVNVIEKTSYPQYANLRIGYRLAINQNGTEFSAEGEKVSENDRTMQAFERTPIHVTGWINGDTVGATFTEEGLRRGTSGRFVWTITAGGDRLRGTFVSTAAESSGSSVATRER